MPQQENQTLIKVVEMRLWSLHPKYLDSGGLVALWREALLAQKVLAGKTKGYRNHPQLLRFKSQKKPMDAIGAYLAEVKKEAEKRGYKFKGEKIVKVPRQEIRIPVASGQLQYELSHLKRKLKTRDKTHLRKISGRKKPQAHPVFTVRKGKIENEKIK